jgi:tetratricopeptide (TPR) repeat protein
MPARLWLIFGISGLNLFLLAGQDSWELHLANARNLRNQAQYKEAEKEYLAAMEGAQVFGSADARLARVWNNLAALYQDMGRYGEAETLYREAIAIWELGPEYGQDLAACLNNLGVVERAMGRHAERSGCARKSNRWI